jgi:hypothetical protein
MITVKDGKFVPYSNSTAAAQNIAAPKNISVQ